MPVGGADVGSASDALKSDGAGTAVAGGLAASIPAACRVITVDVFDTLLLRRPISERRRLMEGARRIAGRLAEEGCERSPDFIYWTRRLAQQAAFRLRRDPLRDPEVTLTDIVDLQQRLLGLTEREEVFRRCELDVESESVELHLRRAQELARLAVDRPVIAISDTTWSAEMVSELLTRKGSVIPFRRIYASADAGTTKRDGGLFLDVAARERFDLSESVHLGDDVRADVRTPKRMGVGHTKHLARPASHVARRKLDGLLHVAGRSLKTPASAPQVTDPESFSAKVMGPLCAEILLRLYAHLDLLQRRDGLSVLFCARGGLVMGALFERFLEATGLPIDAPRHDLMISRLVAARASIARNGDSAFDELGREYHSASLADAVAALAGPDADIAPPPPVAFDKTQLRTWMFSAEGAPFRDALAAQNALFTEHLDTLAGDADRLVLVDTGLYGSTHRLLEDAYPDRRWLSLLVARANYKKLPTPHFPRTIGLLSEQDAYTRSHPPSVVLRYWHLIEDFFEPDLQSVRQFHRDAEGTVRSNLEASGWRDRVLAKPKLAGALRYVEGLDQARLRDVPGEAAGAWRRLRQMVTFPSARDAEILDTGLRSKDFGQEGGVTAIAAPTEGMRGTIQAIRRARWKEGSIAVHAGALRLAPQLGLETLYALRSLRRSLKR